MTGPAPAGLARERTRLAWRRTALAGAVVALLAARLAGVTGGVAGVLPACVTTLAWAALVALAHRRGAQVARGAPAPPGRLVALCGLATVTYAVVGILVVTVV